MHQRFMKVLSMLDLAVITESGRLTILLFVIGVVSVFLYAGQLNSSRLSDLNLFVGQRMAEEPPDPSLPSPNEKIDLDGYHMPLFSAAEATRLSKEAVAARRTTFQIVTAEKDFAQTRKDWVIALAGTGEPNAEYLVGWMHEEWSNIHNSPKANQLAITWYERAVGHGSIAAAGRLGEMYFYSQNSTLPKSSLYKNYLHKAAEGGDPLALIQVAGAYENKNTPEDLHTAMALYEQAAKCNDEYNAEEAKRIIAEMWLLNRAQPSENFRRGETDVFNYVCKYGSFWEAASLARNFESRSSPALIDRNKAAILRKISKSRLDAARKNPAMSRKVLLWDSLRTFCWSIGKSEDVFR